MCLSQLACPLCGRFVSLNSFDPSHFESDIYAVNRTGLGRGRGFAVGPSFSVLGDVTITGPIASRCRKILGLIEGRGIPSSNDVPVFKLEIEKWKGEALRERRACEDLHAKLAELEGRAMYWRSETSELQRGQGEHAAELAGLESEVRKWKSMATGLRAKVEELESELDESEGDDMDDEEEMLAVEEMQEILDRINASANTDFEYLSDAVGFLLEGG